MFLLAIVGRVVLKAIMCFIGVYVKKSMCICFVVKANQ